MDKDELLSLRPRMLMVQAALILDIPLGDIPYGAFRAWLGRFRKANAGTNKKVETKRPSPAREKEPDWRDFKPTPPSAIRKKEETIMRRVTYDDDDY